METETVQLVSNSLFRLDYRQYHTNEKDGENTSCYILVASLLNAMNHTESDEMSLKYMRKRKK
jgi:hypothetical protein